MKNTDNRSHRSHCSLPVTALIGFFFFLLAGQVHGDVPTRVEVQGTVPNPGTQQQELSNITFPAPYNVFEFLVTCAACHGGQVDQQVAHFGNWAGTSMASAARDPVFRANQIIVNSAVKDLTGEDGAGNMCFRCHSPNGWYSGRFDPQLNGAADGSSMLHSVLISTDDEGIPCEMCHRTMGAVTFQRPDLSAIDPVWNMLAGIDDWPHNGGPFVDQAGDPTIAPGNPYGDTTLQIDEGMTYIGRYPGTADIYWSDLPLQGLYTGQTYGIYPDGFIDDWGNDISGLPAEAADGSLIIQLDVPISPPLNADGTYDYNAQSVSPEHATVMYPNNPPEKGFIQTSEFCGTCHDLTIPVLNHGMPEQRTYTEWKYSAFGREGPDATTCQDCHMPRLSHEYADDIPGSYNADPFGEPGGWPYSKPRTNTAVHKLAGANRDLPMMMKFLYPEVDMEPVGGGEGAAGVWFGTGSDPRIFPGMLTNRDSMWERNRRNSEIMLREGVDVEIASGPAFNPASGKWEVQVRVTNNSGHRIPSGYPDGRRMWLQVEVTDAGGAVVYESGHYDRDTSTLFTDSSMAGLKRALTPQIDDADNAVMIYERVTGTCEDNNADGIPDQCTPSKSLLNNYILFDNRIPPLGFVYDDYRQAGVKFWNYDPATFVPYEQYNPRLGQSSRYPDGENRDLVTYTFSAPEGSVLTARATAYWQTHSREFMEHLRESDTSTVRPQGPPRVWELNYPLTPNYLSDEFGLAGVVQEMQADGWLAPDETLRDNWGGVAYAAWYKTGRGAPYPVAVADTADAPPPAPAFVRVYPEYTADGTPVGGVTNPDTGLLEPYTQLIKWSQVDGADGYLIWIRYGIGTTTASWDKLAIVLEDNDPATPLELINTAINVNKTYVYKIQAFNGAGLGPDSVEVAARTPWDLPLPPDNLLYNDSTAESITMTWYDAADNEDGWIVFRQDLTAAPLIGFYEIARFPSTTGFGGVIFSDGDFARPDIQWADGYTPPQPEQCYNYVVESYNASGTSGWNTNGPVQMCTMNTPGAPRELTATIVSDSRVDLSWTAGPGTTIGYRLERSGDGGATWPTAFDIPDMTVTGYSDLAIQPGSTYWYRVFAYNTAGDSEPSNMVPVCFLTGDLNGDSTVSLADLVLFRTEYGTTGTGLAGDFDGDGDVDLSDFITFRQNYGAGCP